MGDIAVMHRQTQVTHHNSQVKDETLLTYS